MRLAFGLARQILRCVKVRVSGRVLACGSGTVWVRVGVGVSVSVRVGFGSDFGLLSEIGQLLLFGSALGFTSSVCLDARF